MRCGDVVVRLVCSGALWARVVLCRVPTVAQLVAAKCAAQRCVLWLFIFSFLFCTPKKKCASAAPQNARTRHTFGMNPEILAYTNAGDLELVDLHGIPLTPCCAFRHLPICRRSATVPSFVHWTSIVHTNVCPIAHVRCTVFFVRCTAHRTCLPLVPSFESSSPVPLRRSAPLSIRVS